MEAYLFRKTTPSEPDCRIPSIAEGPPWPSLIGRGEDFVGDTSEVERIRLQRPYAKLRDFLWTGIGEEELTVSDRVRVAVEEAEPGAHQFLPIELLQPDGSAFPVRYWGMNIRHHVDSYRWGRHTYFPTATDGMTDPHREVPRISITWPRDPSDLVLDRATVAGLHFWIDTRSRRLFLSDHALSVMQRRRVGAFTADRVTLR